MKKILILLLFFITSCWLEDNVINIESVDLNKIEWEKSLSLDTESEIWWGYGEPLNQKGNR